MSARRALLAASLALVAACYTSPTPEAYMPPRSPRGVFGTIYMAKGRHFDAELLAVTDTAYVLGWDEYVGVARYEDVRRAAFDDLGSMTAWTHIPTRAMLADARLFARFPYGIPDSALVQLLAVRGQSRMENFATFTPPAR